MVEAVASVMPAERVPPDKGDPTSAGNAQSTKGDITTHDPEIPAKQASEDKTTRKILRPKPIRVPWTEEHWRDHKKSQKAQITKPIPERESTYRFLHNGIEEPTKVECLHVDADELDGGYESDTGTGTPSPHVDDLQETLSRNWGTLFTGGAALRNQTPGGTDGNKIFNSKGERTNTPRSRQTTKVSMTMIGVPHPH